MTYAVHLSDDLLIRSIDAELSLDERLYAEPHLAACESCRRRRREWAESLELVETCVASVVPSAPANSRMRLAAALRAQSDSNESSPIVGSLSLESIRRMDARRVPATHPWRQLAVAASIACAVLSGLALQRYLPFMAAPSPDPSAVEAGAENDYLPLPYSSAALSTAQAEVVRVQMPVSALREAGIDVASPDEEYVDADILLGLDGQPQGIRVVNDGSALN